MFHRSDRSLAISLALVLLVGCTEPAPAPSTTPDAADIVPVTTLAAAPTDEVGLRAAAATALSEQRIYAPAGDNAIEHYLALRAQSPDDAALATALLELLPYALIGSEQAMVREDFAEARRLLGLIERADPQAPSLARLREGIATAEAQSAQRLVAQAEAEKLRLQQEQLAEEQQAEAAARQRAPATAAAPPPTASSPPPLPAPSPAAATPVIAAPVASSAATATRPTAPASTPPRVPRLLSAPNPRYPLMALRRKLEGEVTVEFTIQPDGSVDSPRVVSATPAGTFEEAALVATRRWRFETGTSPVRTSRVVQFRLAEGG